MKFSPKEHGFTLIELVMVVVIMGVIATGTFSFISSGTAIFADVTARDQLLSDSRFVVERLNREIRQSVPNSAREKDDGSSQCIEFLPFNASSTYVDIPVLPEPAQTTAQTFPIVRLDGSSLCAVDCGLEIVVYPMNTSHIYASNNERRYTVNTITDAGSNIWNVSLIQDSVRFSKDSPARRFYLTNFPVSYCVRSGNVYRHSNYGFNPVQSINITDLGSGVLMGENLTNDMSQSDDLPFKVHNASLERNGLVNLYFKFARNNEAIEFNNEIHIPNVP